MRLAKGSNPVAVVAELATAFGAILTGGRIAAIPVAVPSDHSDCHSGTALGGISVFVTTSIDPVVRPPIQIRFSAMEVGEHPSPLSEGVMGH